MKFKKMFLNGLWILVLLFAFGGTPAFATCAEDIKAVSGKMTAADTGISGEEMQTALALLVEARALCKSGDEAGAAVVLAELKTLLGMN